MLDPGRSLADSNGVSLRAIVEGPQGRVVRVGDTAYESRPGAVRMLFVGGSLPPATAACLPGFSQAGVLFQEGLLGGVARAGVEVTRVLSVRPVPSFPRFRRIWFGFGGATTGSDVPVTLLPFLNLGLLRALTLGVSAFVSVLRWGWVERRRPGRRVVVQYNVNAPPVAAVLLAGRLIGARVVAVVADVQVPGSGLLPDTAIRRANFRLQTRSLRLLDGLVAVTRRIADDFAPGVPSLIVEGGVASEAVSASQVVVWPAVADDANLFVVMYAGDLSEIKGVSLLLDAFALVGGADVRLWITGRGPLQPAVEAAAARDPRIRYLGYLTYEELLARYARATVLINPHSTRYESSRYLFPSKLIEYLASGRPVITTCGSGVESEYRQVSFLLRDETPKALAQLIVDVRRRGRAELERVGARARAFVREQKSWKHQGLRVADFIRAIAVPEERP